MITNQLPNLNLRGYTRGRSSNPFKGHPGTQGSRTPLNFGSGFETRLDLSNLKKRYGEYFGVIMSLLYKSDRRAPLTTKIPKPKNLLREIFQQSNLRNASGKKIAKMLGLNNYNIGCKLNEILIQLNHNVPLSLEQNLFFPNSRILWYPWNNNPSLSFPRITNPLKSEFRATSDNEFKKFTEICLTDEEQIRYILAYEDYLRNQPCPKNYRIR